MLPSRVPCITFVSVTKTNNLPVNRRNPTSRPRRCGQERSSGAHRAIDTPCERRAVGTTVRFVDRSGNQAHLPVGFAKSFPGFPGEGHGEMRTVRHSLPNLSTPSRTIVVISHEMSARGAGRHDLDFSFRAHRRAPSVPAKKRGAIVSSR